MVWWQGSFCCRVGSNVGRRVHAVFFCRLSIKFPIVPRYILEVLRSWWCHYCSKLRELNFICSLAWCLRSAACSRMLVLLVCQCQQQRHRLPIYCEQSRKQCCYQTRQPTIKFVKLHWRRGCRVTEECFYDRLWGCNVLFKSAILIFMQWILLCGWWRVWSRRDGRVRD